MTYCFLNENEVSVVYQILAEYFHEKNNLATC